MPSPRGSSLTTRLEAGALAFVLLAALGWIGWVLGRQEALPPRTIVMATGPEGGAYAEIGARYREVLARKGLRVHLRATEGDSENLSLLERRGSGVSVAFLQSGTTTAASSPDLVSLGAVFFQPVWIFRRSPAAHVAFERLAGERLAAGGEASGTRAAILRLLSVAGVDPRSIALVPLSPIAAADAMAAREVDAMALVGSWDSPVVRRMVGAPNIELDGFPRADAYVALDPAFEKLVLPMGVGDMASNRPPRDVPLLALRVSLAVREDLNPAIQYLLLEAASEIHAGPGIFQKAGQFPSAAGIDLPLSSDARHFYKSGRPILQRYLPYFVAVIVEKLLLALLPVFGLLIPMVRVVPGVYRTLMEYRIIRLYGELKLLEAEMEERGGDGDDLVRRLDDLELRANHLHVPLRFSQMVYTLKQHILLVQGHLAARRPGQRPGDGPRDPEGPAK